MIVANFYFLTDANRVRGGRYMQIRDANKLTGFVVAAQTGAASQTFTSIYCLPFGLSFLQRTFHVGEGQVGEVDDLLLDDEPSAASIATLP